MQAVDDVLARLDFVRPGADTAKAAFAFDFDCGSSRSWPDVPFDTTDPRTHYRDDAERERVRAVLEGTARLLGERAPRALELANGEVQRALLRRSSAIPGAFSASNRSLIGTCLLANFERADDGVLVCAEAVVHESTHQYLYRLERDQGAFCDLGEERSYRSPWSGNRLPLHSLVHATFVWFGLLSLWCALARSATEGELRFARDRVAIILHGFAFLPDVIGSPAFPSYAVATPVQHAMERMCRATARIGKDLDRPRVLDDALQAFAQGAWIRPVAMHLATA
jgi:hypothetical protein